MATASELITQLYVGYYDRAPDPAGLNYWVGRFNVGMSLLEIAQSFSVQPESASLYGFLSAPLVGLPDSFLDSVYRNLFNRPIEPGGLAYWKGELANGKPVGRVIVDIISGAQGADKTIVDNKVSVGLFYADHVSTPQSGGFRIGEARQVLDGVNATAASVNSAQSLVRSLAQESLTLIFNDPAGVLTPFEAGIRASVHAAWDQWEMYFTRRVPIEIEINFEAASATTLASARSLLLVPTGEFDQGRRIGMVGVASELKTGVDSNGSEPDAEITLSNNLSQFVFRSSVNDPLPNNKFDAITVFAHEIGHILGFSSGGGFNLISSFDRFVSGATSSQFTGTAAMAANNGNPVPLVENSPAHLADSTDLMHSSITNGQFRPVEALHIAILQDTGLPVSVLAAGGLV